MKDMKGSGKKPKLSKTLVQEKTQCSLDQSKKDKDHSTEEQSITFRDAEEALSILLAQIGNARIRKMWEDKVMGYMRLQEARNQILEARNKQLGWNDVDNHVQALAKLWDEEDIKCPPHQR